MYQPTSKLCKASSNKLSLNTAKGSSWTVTIFTWNTFVIYSRWVWGVQWETAGRGFESSLKTWFIPSSSSAWICWGSSSRSRPRGGTHRSLLWTGTGLWVRCLTNALHVRKYLIILRMISPHFEPGKLFSRQIISFYWEALHKKTFFFQFSSFDNKHIHL